eukprot:TRINITY_DN22944_c0_g1_i1.p2 TRINITY_DN22944_c0_g1~~TRINITY_DN22944_c0_g1_i1.p2  ORF type:complete len:138 (+),score=19.08 TRINITY_DN22944_c0_g1_i1:68-481(+)
MCEILSWEMYALEREEGDNDGVHAMSEAELDELLGNLTTSSEETKSDDSSEETVRPPCEHNCWDNLRAKRDTVTLRCRLCQRQWKTQTLRLQRCPNFSRTSKITCPEGEECALIHVYRFKLSSKKRNKMLRDAALSD